jgi:hypothetical protein
MSMRDEGQIAAKRGSGMGDLIAACSSPLLAQPHVR